MVSVRIVDDSDADSGLPTRRPWWFGPAVVAVAVGATIGMVVSEPAPPPTPAELRVYCAGRLARFKLPATIAIVDKLPHSATGKVRKGELH